MRYNSLNPLNQLFLYFKNFEDELHYLETVYSRKLRFISWKIFCIFMTVFPVIQIIIDQKKYIYLLVSGISFCFLLGFQYARYQICLMQCLVIQIMVQIFIGIYYSDTLSLAKDNNSLAIISQLIICMIMLDSQVFFIEFLSTIVFTVLQLLFINPFSALLCVNQITIALLILSFKYFFYRVSRQLYVITSNFNKWEHILDTVLPINYIISTFETRTHNIGIYSQNKKVRDMGIRNSDEFKEWLEKLTILSENRSMLNKQRFTMKNHLINRHTQLLKDIKNLNKIRDKVNENQILYAELEDETTFRFEITPLFMAAEPLLLIAFEDITQYQKSNKKKNEQLNLCSMIFDNLKYISCKLEQSLQTIMNSKNHPKMKEIQKISSYFINQLLVFVDVPDEIPLQRFKFKDIFTPIQTIFSNYLYSIEENIMDVSVNSNILLFKYCLTSLLSCFESSKQQVNIILKNIQNKYIMIEVSLVGGYQGDLFKKMNQSSNDFSSRKQIGLFQKFTEKISPQEIQINFNSGANMTQIFLSLYINLEEKQLEKSQNWFNFINKTQQILTSTSNQNNYSGEILNGINSINHSYMSTLSQFFLNDKTTQISQPTPKYRKISLQNNIRKFSKEFTRKRNSSINMLSPKNEILEQYTRMYPTIQENDLSEIKSIASISNVNEEGKPFSNRTLPLSQQITSQFTSQQIKFQSETIFNQKSLFSNQKFNSAADIENGLLNKSPKNGSPNHDFVDLLDNHNKKLSKEECNFKTSYLSLSCKSQKQELHFDSKKEIGCELDNSPGNRMKEFTLNRQKQNTNQIDQQEQLQQNLFSPPHFKIELTDKPNFIPILSNNHSEQISNQYDKQQYESTTSISQVSQKHNDKSIDFYNHLNHNNSLSQSISQFDNSLCYQFQNSYINFHDRNKFNNQFSPSNKFNSQQIKIM